MPTMDKKKLLGAAAFCAALAGGGVAGAVFGSPLSSGAQESSSTTTVAPDTGAAPDGAPHLGMRIRRAAGVELGAAAKAIGITPQELKTELPAGKTIAQVAQDHNVDVDKVIDAMVTEAETHLRERITNIVNNPMPKIGERREEIRGDFTDIAGVIGITPQELKTELQSGKSIAQVAQAHDVDPQKVIDKLVADGVPSDRATNIVNHVGGFGRPGWHHDGDGPGEPAPDDSTTTTDGSGA
jgi:uncharacterized protein (DUF433 family)